MSASNGLVIKGKDVKYITTLSSQYDQGHLLNIGFDYMGQRVRGRISTDEILKLVDGVTFKATMARKLYHLEVITTKGAK